MHQDIILLTYSYQSEGNTDTEIMGVFDSIPAMMAVLAEKGITLTPYHQVRVIKTNEVISLY